MPTRSPHDDAVPAIIRIGVIGHRNIGSDSKLTDTACDTFARISRDVRLLVPRGDANFVILSPLADGADRLLTRAAFAALSSLSRTKVILEAVLPMALERYEATFQSDASRLDFHTLYKQRACECVLPSLDRDEDAYAQASRFLVDNCDILVAIWNGQAAAGPGGTAAGVEYARSIGRHVVIIDGNDGRGVTDVAPIGAGADYLKRLKAVRALNRIGTGDAAPANGTANSVSSAPPALQLLLYRTDTVARKAGILSRLASDAIQWFSVMAVVVVAAQALYFPEHHEIVWLEIVFVGAIVLLSLAAYRVRWQKRWADYRYCAERLRALTHLCRLPDDVLRQAYPDDRLFTGVSPADWISLLLDWARIECRRAPVARTELDRRAILQDWLEDQISFYRRRQHKLHVLDRLGSAVGLGLFIVTAIAALFHVLYQSPEIGRSLVFVAIVGPTLGGALAGIRAHRDHVRLMERYRQCAEQVEQVAVHLNRTDDRDMAAALILSAHNIMLAEHSDWRITAHTREVGPR